MQDASRILNGVEQSAVLSLRLIKNNNNNNEKLIRVAYCIRTLRTAMTLKSQLNR